MLLAFLCLRNEAARLPHFLDHYRKLGVGHFLIVDNGSDDGSTDLLHRQPDVSVWHAGGSYRASRFGMTWVGWLLMRYGHGHWCLTVDADELLVYPHCPDRTLADLTAWMDKAGQAALPALMIEMYPKGPVSAAHCPPGADPLAVIPWFDAQGYASRWQGRAAAARVTGGPRLRRFFADRPEQAPTLNKLPLVRWNRRFAYDTSTHRILPRRLSRGGEATVTGALLHTKFLSDAVDRARQEKARGEHFNSPEKFHAYYDAVAEDPDFWTGDSVRYDGWQQLVSLGLMSRGGWS